MNAPQLLVNPTKYPRLGFKAVKIDLLFDHVTRKYCHISELKCTRHGWIRVRLEAYLCNLLVWSRLLYLI